MEADRDLLLDVETNYEPLDMELVGRDGNAFAIMARFRREARRAGWLQQDIDTVLDECKQGDYNHLLQTIIRFTK